MTIANDLSAPFPKEVEQTLKKGGASLTYIPVSEVITRLNKVIGVNNWSSSILSCQRDALDPDFVVAHVALTAVIDGQTIHKEGIGGQKIKRTKSGDIVDLGDEMKGAVSDALKKAAQQLGVGLYLARSEDALSIEEHEQVEASRDPEIRQMWDQFVAASRTLSVEAKKVLAERWSEYADGGPKPTIDTVNLEDLDFLLSQVSELA